MQLISIHVKYKLNVHHYHLTYFVYRFYTYSWLQTKVNIRFNMDVNFTLFNIIANVGRRRRNEQWWTGTHTKTKVCHIISVFTVHRNIYNWNFRLMNWIQSKVPDLPITNFTTDWNSGKAVGALVDAVAPGLCPDWPVNNIIK